MDNQQAGRKINELWERIKSEAYGVPRKEVPLLDEIIALCDEHGLTHYDCLTARQRLEEIGENDVARGRQSKN